MQRSRERKGKYKEQSLAGTESCRQIHADSTLLGGDSPAASLATYSGLCCPVSFSPVQRAWCLRTRNAPLWDPKGWWMAFSSRLAPESPTVTYGLNRPLHCFLVFPHPRQAFRELPYFIQKGRLSSHNKVNLPTKYTDKGFSFHIQYQKNNSLPVMFLKKQVDYCLLISENYFLG